MLAPGTDDPEFDFEAVRNLPNQVCRSRDMGHTWQRADTVTVPCDPADPDCWCVPFGDIIVGPDGVLAAGFYTGRKGDERNTAWVLRSTDDGLHWGDWTMIAADGYNETDLLHLGGGRWLAACRTVLVTAEPLVGAHVQLFASDDNGRAWTNRGPLTPAGSSPSHLTRLADGRVLFTFGIRTGKRGVGVRYSSDEGCRWTPPRVLLECEGARDGGYPSSVQTADGGIVTAYYTNTDLNVYFPEASYHMGVVRWWPDPPAPARL